MGESVTRASGIDGMSAWLAGGNLRFCGKDWDGMNKILDTLCELEDNLMATGEEEEALDIAIQCVTQIMNRMKDGKMINWD